MRKPVLLLAGWLEARERDWGGGGGVLGSCGTCILWHLHTYVLVCMNSYSILKPARLDYAGDK